MTDCGCGCRRDGADIARRELHELRRREFAVYLETRPDARTFSPPTLNRIVELNAAEWDAPASCVRREHSGSPSHPAHSR